MLKTKKSAKEVAKEAQEHMKANKADVKIYRRIQVIYLKSLGKGHEEIAEVTLFSTSYIAKIVTKFNQKGFEALLSDNRNGGNKRKVSEWQEIKFLKSWRRRSEKGQITSTKEMRIDFCEKYGISITESAFLRLLKRHGWRKIEPQKQHKKVADAKTQRASKKLNVEPEKSEKRFIWVAEAERFE